MRPDILDIVFLPALFLVCAVTSFEDLREGKIRNRLILYGLLWGAGGYALLGISRFFIPELTSGVLANTLFAGSWGRLLLLAAANSACALVCGFALFHYGQWSAGDAKLFFVIALLLPLKYYFRHFLPVFPAFNIFLNTMAIALCYISGETVFKLFLLLRSAPKGNLLKEVVNSSLVRLLGAFKLFLAAAVVFASVMCVRVYSGLSPKASVTLALFALLFLIFAGRTLNAFLERPALRRGFYAVSACFFTLLLFSRLRNQVFTMAVSMSSIFLVVYFITNILPELAAKYRLQSEYMPFAIWISLGTLATMFIKGSFLYLFFL